MHHNSHFRFSSVCFISLFLALAISQHMGSDKACDLKSIVFLSG